jgi:hypothetical protein
MIRCLDHAPGADLMNLAWLSVGALVAAVTLSCTTTTINVGILSMALRARRRRLPRRHDAGRRSCAGFRPICW